MRGPQPPGIALTPAQRHVLDRLARRHSSSQQLLRRVGIILEAAEGANNEQVARKLGLYRETVRKWRTRWLEAQDLLRASEAEGDERALTRVVEEVFTDEPRSGAPGKFTPEQVVGIVALACEVTGEGGTPVTHWTPGELASEAVSRGIVPSISPSSVGRFLGRGGSQASSGAPVAYQRARR